MPLSSIEDYLMHGALGAVLLNPSNDTPEGTMASIKMLRVSLAYLESRYRHQIADRHRAYEAPPARTEAKPNGEAKPKNKGGRPRKQAAAPAPAQPQMFEPPAMAANEQGLAGQ
jgi:hypothetical protein